MNVTEQDPLPSLLDRLTGVHAAHGEDAAVGQRLTGDALRRAVLRDLRWLFNSSGVGDLPSHPLARASTLNYGLPAVSGVGMTKGDLARLEASIRAAILAFEPRIIPSSLQLALDREGERPMQVAFQINCLLMPATSPVSLHLRTAIDMDMGRVEISGGGVR